MTKNNCKLKIPQSIKLPGNDKIYCSPELGPDGKLNNFPILNVHTMYEAFYHGKETAKKYDDTRMLGKRIDGKYEWLSHEDVLEKVESISSGLIYYGIKPGQESRVAIFSINCVEWMLTALSCIFQNIVIVPINRFLDDTGIIHILNQCEIEYIFVKSEEDFKKIKSLQTQCPKLQTVIVFDNVSYISDINEDDLKIVPFGSIEESGKANLVPHNVPAKDDIIIICYTSGSSGTPKGVIITHSNVVATVACFIKIHKPIAVNGADILLSYLPLAHIFEFVAECIFILQGYKIGYFGGDIKQFAKDAQLLKPTFLPVVPRVLNAIYDKIQTGLKTASSFNRIMFDIAFKRKSLYMLRTGEYRHPVYDRLIFSKIQKTLGGKLTFMIVGGSGPQTTILNFMKIVLGCSLVEGYGQTETCSGTICQNIGDASVGNVGSPIVSLHVKLINVNKDYKDENVGELCVRGLNVSPGYFRHTDPDSFDKEGWLHSGDIARRNADGSFSIIDRKKELFKLSQGEYIAPLKVENCYTLLEVISQIFVTGYSEESYCVAIVVPDEFKLRNLANELNINNAEKIPLKELCNTQIIVEYVLAKMNDHAMTMKLSGIEKVRRIWLESTPFSIDNNLFTPTFKLKRYYASQLYKDEIAQMYPKKRNEDC